MKAHIYSVKPDNSLSIGKPRLGHISNYYPGVEIITDEEVAAVQAAAEKLDVDVLNTRLVLEMAPEVKF